MNRRLLCTGLDSLEVSEEPIPSAPPTGLIVKVCYAGICHSDLHGLHDPGLMSPAVLPMVLGHEISGLVHSVGGTYAKEPSAYCVGDKVAAYTWGGCQACSACTSGNHVLCTNKNGPHSEAFGVWVDGGFQEYLVVRNPWRLIKLSPSCDLALSCLAPCSGITGYNAIELCKSAIEKAIEMKGYANVVLNGAGALSLWATEISKAIHGDTVKLCVTDILEEKLKDSKAKGADMTLCLPKEGDTAEVVEKIREQFGGQAVDAAVDFVNIQTTQQTLFASLAPGGTQVCVGLYGREVGPLNTLKMIFEQIRVQGCYTGSKYQLHDVIKLIEQGKVKGPPITLIKFEDIESTMMSMIAGATYRGRYVAEICKA